MALAREGAAAVLLRDGRVLVTGGRGPAGATARAEVFDPGPGTFAAAPPMGTARAGHTAVLLDDGRVMVAGGSGAAPLPSLEIYDPARNAWAPGPDMAEGRSGHTATRLADGRILLAGGEGPKGPSATFEVFSAARKAFVGAGALSSPRRRHAAVLLADGRVLIVGGSNGTATLATTDVFDPARGRVAAGPSLATPRAGASATLLPNGRVLVAGGSDGSADLVSLELFDPRAGTFSAAGGSLVAARSGHLAFLLPLNNQVLILGGTAAGVALPAAELYTPWTDGSAPTDPLWTPRAGAVGTPLRSAGRLFAAGGAAVTAAEVYTYATLAAERGDAAGAPIVLSGTGWQPGETVTLLLREQPPVHAERTLTVTADAAGRFRTSLPPETHDVDVLHTVLARGAAAQAQALLVTAGGAAPVATAEAIPGAAPGAATTRPQIVPALPLPKAPAKPARGARARQPRTQVSSDGTDRIPENVADDTVADFAAGSPAACRVVAHTGDGDGEVIQQPLVLNEFTALGAGWEARPVDDRRHGVVLRRRGEPGRRAGQHHRASLPRRARWSSKPPSARCRGSTRASARPSTRPPRPGPSSARISPATRCTPSPATRPASRSPSS